MVKNLPTKEEDARDAGSTLGSGRSPGGGLHGQSTLVSFSPWGCKELGRTE